MLRRKETYRYKPNRQKKTHTAYFISEREMSLDEEFIELQRVQKQLLERINHIISGPEQARLRDQMSYIIEVLGKTADAMEACFSKEPQLKMQYFFGMVEVLQALNIAIVGADDENLQYEDLVHDTHVKELVFMMKQIFELKVETVSISEKSTQEVSSSHGKCTMSMKEKIDYDYIKIIENRLLIFIAQHQTDERNLSRKAVEIAFVEVLENSHKQLTPMEANESHKQE